MFSEYASRFLSKPATTAPLFERSTSSLDTDTEAFLGWVDNSLSESSDGRDSIPPEDLVIERQVAEGAARVPPEPVAGHEARAAQNGFTARAAPPTRGWDDRIEAAVGASYVVSASMTLAAATLVSFTPPSAGGVYPIFGKMSRSLAWLGVASALSATAWLETMRRNPKGMVQLAVFIVPVVLGTGGLYLALGSWHNAAGHGLVHTAMRLAALAPLAAAVGWIMALRRDHSKLGRASEMIALALDVVNKCPLLVGTAALCGACASMLSFLWVLFVSRATLEGSLSVPFALLFSFMYLWTWAVLCNMQRCIVAIVTTECVGGQHNAPHNPVRGIGAVSPWGYVLEVSRRFGACATAGLVAVLVRTPALLVGGRAARLAQLVVGAPVALVRPQTLTVAVAQRSSLAAAAQKLAEVEVDKSTYRLARLLLRATKLTFAVVVAFVAWVRADHADTSAAVYSYLVAMAAFGVGWTVFGAAENTLGMVLEAMMVNYALGARGDHGELQRVFGIY